MSRILRELLRTPRFKKSVNVILGELDPENGALLVRTLFREDPGFFLGMLAAAPDLANAVVSALVELTAQLGAFPPGLLTSFAALAIENLDSEGLGKAVAGFTRLLGEVRDSGGQEFSEALAGMLRRFAKGVKGVAPVKSQPPVPPESVVATLLTIAGSAAARFGREAAREGSDANRAVAELARALKELAAENPEFMRSVALPLIEAGKRAISAAGGSEGGEVS